MRQLIRGFTDSPRLVFALLTDFLLRWNQNIGVRVRGLDKKYDKLCDRPLLGNGIEHMLAWPARESPTHPNWVSTRNVQYTGERFGFIECQY